LRKKDVTKMENIGDGKLAHWNEAGVTCLGALAVAAGSVTYRSVQVAEQVASVEQTERTKGQRSLDNI
jgi:hypothetical protein